MKKMMHKEHDRHQKMMEKMKKYEGSGMPEN